MENLFLEVAKDNKDFPIGAGIWLRIHPEDILTSTDTSWVFSQNSVRMPEFSAPGLGKKSNKVVVDLEVKENANGVLYALAGSGGGLTCFVEDGKVVYEYNMMLMQTTTLESKEKLAAGKHTIEITTVLAKPMSPATVTMKIDGKEVGTTVVPMTVPAAFSANETLDIGTDLGSPVSLRYFDKAPFKFNGKINSVKVNLIKNK